MWHGGHPASLLLTSMSSDMSGAASRNRGANAERAVVNYLKGQGWAHARRVLAGDGHQHSDIECWAGISIEIKDRTSSAWPSWREQAITQARPEDVVVVMRRTRGITDVGRWVAQMPEDDFYWIGGSGLFPFKCPRLHTLWVETTFANVCALVRATGEENDALRRRTT
jgi:hypothetical protein